MAIAAWTSADPANGGIAKEMLESLVSAYPNHSWIVRIDGGVVHIKHGGISSTIGMCLHFSKIKGDAAARKKDVIMAAGELLERARLRRGVNNGDPARVLDGGDKFKWKAPLINVPVIH